MYFGTLHNIFVLCNSDICLKSIFWSFILWDPSKPIHRNYVKGLSILKKAIGCKKQTIENEI